MDYQRIYSQLIERARSRVLDGYVERHHVIPKCMGGNDQIENLVQLTPEEHFLAHVLLVKIHPEERNLILAVQKMTVGHKGRRSRKLYGWLKKKHAARMRELQSGEGNSQYGSRWINNGNGIAKKHKGELPDGWFYGKVLKTARQARQENTAKKEFDWSKYKAAFVRLDSGERSRSVASDFGCSHVNLLKLYNKYWMCG